MVRCCLRRKPEFLKHFSVLLGRENIQINIRFIFKNSRFSSTNLSVVKCHEEGKGASDGYFSVLRRAVGDSLLILAKEEPIYGLHCSQNHEREGT